MIQTSDMFQGPTGRKNRLGACVAIRDFSTSHSSPGRGRVYDDSYAAGSLAFYWENFERPLLEKLFTLFSRQQRGSHLRYLDFACGTGRILQTASSYFSELVGIDVSESMLSEARRKVPQAKLIQADVCSETLDLGRFDVVTLFRFLLNAGEDLRRRTLSWVRSVITNDGILLLNNHRNAWSTYGLWCGLRNALGLRWHNLLCDRSVHALLRRCGFRVVDRFGFGLIPHRSNHLLLPARFVRRAERTFGARACLQPFAENHIYVCRPA
jgi:SAM-dependent methyltransferase